MRVVPGLGLEQSRAERTKPHGATRAAGSHNHYLAARGKPRPTAAGAFERLKTGADWPNARGRGGATVTDIPGQAQNAASSKRPAGGAAAQSKAAAEPPGPVRAGV